MRHTLKKILGPAIGLALVIMIAPNSKADTMTFDTALTSPGLYFGTGNMNSNFTTETNGTTELGLSVIQRYVGPIDPGGVTYTTLPPERLLPLRAARLGRHGASTSQLTPIPAGHFGAALIIS
jgi:hypothetical protein